MLSTLINYRLYSSDLTRSLARIEADAVVSREARYYEENIGKVGSVDDLMADHRLYSYALKAYGLEEQIPARAFVRQILESDLSDPASFANRLSDTRYRSFAAAFDFSAAKAEPTLQSQAQTDRLIEAYSEHLVRGGAIAAEKAQYFEARIAAIGSVDDFLADRTLVEMTAKIAGLDPAFVSIPYLRGVLTGTDPGAGASSGLQFLAGALSFAEGGPAQTPAQTAEFISRFFIASGQAGSMQAAGFDGRYFEQAALSVRTVEELLDDETILRVLQGVTVLDENSLLNLLSRPQDDPNSPLARLVGDDAAVAARRAVLLKVKASFDLENGAVPDGQAASDPQRLSALLEDFYAADRTRGAGEIALKTNAFRVQLTRMNSINDLLGRDPVYGRQAFEYILKAFDLDPATEGASKIRRVLTSDPSDPNSYVRKLKDDRYEKLASAFNFDADGRVRSERLVQSVRTQQETAALYAASFGPDQSEDRKAGVRKETVAYLEAVGGVRSLDDLLSNDKVLAFALKAHGLDGENLSKADLRKLLTSDLTDPQSFVRSVGDKRYTDFAGSFNIGADGRISAGGGGVQDAGSFLTTQNLYLLQMMEERAGETGEGTRLALYFLRKSPEIRNAFSILADRALFEVVRTALGLPEQMSQLDIDRQAKILESRLNFDDFNDPKALDKFISRFAALYDMNNGSAASDPVLALFGGAGAGGMMGFV